MLFIEELRRAFDQLRNMLAQDQNKKMLDMSYAEFTLNCFAGYSQQIYDTILAENAPLAKAFCAVGVDQPRDQLMMLLDTFYLSLRIQ